MGKEEVKIKLQLDISTLFPLTPRTDFNHTPLISLQFTGLRWVPCDKDTQGIATALELPHIPGREEENQTQT